MKGTFPGGIEERPQLWDTGQKFRFYKDMHRFSWGGSAGTELDTQTMAWSVQARWSAMCQSRGTALDEELLPGAQDVVEACSKSSYKPCNYFFFFLLKAMEIC